jgi:serine phosphatase RsbU (regulator of sigma subunit)/pSer/pThr/pTyr-binding forkhead associated (FHA) protein
MTREVLIILPNGKTQSADLKNDRWTVGRSTDNDFGFPEDSGLSRQHLAFENENGTWIVRDLGSKNGTYVNEHLIQSKHRLSPGDKITASLLTVVFEPQPAKVPQVSIVFDRTRTDLGPAETLSTSLNDVISSQTISAKPTRGTSEHWKTPLTAFLRAGKELSQGRPLPELFEVILDLSIEAVGAERGVLMTLEGERLAVQASRGNGFRISTTVRDQVLNQKASLLIRNVQDEEAFRSMQSIVSQGVRALMAVPLQTDNQVIGLIYVDTSHWLREFSSDDLNLLTVMANVAAIRIERERLAELENARRRMASELEQAAEIQSQFLPACAPQVPGLELAGFNASCRTVGGDYYDFLTYPDGRVAVMVGDVCGKGMPAALLMMGLQARVQVLAAEPNRPAVVVDRLNRVLAAAELNTRFISFFYALLDPVSGEFAYSNAGHNPPLLVRANGTVEWLTEGGPVLGIVRDAAYDDVRCVLNTGDVAVLYSDGVTDATNPEEQDFGESRLSEVLQQVHQGSADAILSALTTAVKGWAAGTPAPDDITLVVVRKT